MKSDELTINCDGICKQRKKINELMILTLRQNPKGLSIYICKDCLSKARPFKIEDIEYY
jgi:hypothetical protein